MNIPCPICEDPLFVSDPKRAHKFFPEGSGRMMGGPKAKYFQPNYRVTGKPPIPPANPVVSSRCGHVFHKKCIMTYMRVFRGELKQSAVECPCCKCQVILTLQLPIDFSASENCGQLAGKEFRVIRALNKELQEQTKDLTSRLESLESKLKSTIEKLPLEESAAGLKEFLAKAEEKAEQTDAKAKRAEAKARKAATNLKDIRERYTRFEQNWNMANGDAGKSEELLAFSAEVLEQNGVQNTGSGLNPAHGSSSIEGN